MLNRNGYGSDYGAEPFIVNIDCFAKQNPYYRTALWTGNHLQVTLMSIPVHGDIGLEMHSSLDQFICIEDGYALVMMGKSETVLNYQQRVNSSYAVIIPAGTWHNIINIGKTPLKLYSIYAPPQHPFGTVHKTKQEAEDSEKYFAKRQKDLGIVNGYSEEMTEGCQGGCHEQMMPEKRLQTNSRFMPF